MPLLMFLILTMQITVVNSGHPDWSIVYIINMIITVYHKNETIFVTFLIHTIEEWQID